LRSLAHPQCDHGYAPDQLRVVPSRGLRHARQARLVGEIGIGIYFQDPWATGVVDPQVDTAVPLSLHRAPSGLREPAQPIGETLRDLGGAYRAAAEILGRSDLPLGGIREDRPRAFGHRTEIDLGAGKRAIADDPDVELAAGDV